MGVNNEVSKNIQELVDKGLNERLHNAMGNACALVRNDAIKNAPQKTGALKRSIDMQVSDDGTEGTIFSNLAYAPYVEVGTGKYAKEGGRDTPWRYPYYFEGRTEWATTEGMKAQPYLEPALQQNNTKIRECFEGLF